MVELDLELRERREKSSGEWEVGRGVKKEERAEEQQSVLLKQLREFRPPRPAHNASRERAGLATSRWLNGGQTTPALIVKSLPWCDRSGGTCR
jgi:hypothetical protein